MVTINEVLERFNKIFYSDSIDDDVKAKWLIDLEGRLYDEVYKTHQGNEEYSLPKSYPEDANKELFVKAPYDNLYDLYLLAQIDLVNREADNYNNSALVFNNALDEFKKEYHRTHMPVNSGGIKNYW